ncbi:unnamed protein product [Ectocarpus sp. 12 AP-2014]
MDATDRDALVTLFHATGGTSWKRSDNWNTTAELSTWYGIKVDGQDHVVELGLVANNLRGSIPKELGALTNLRILHLSRNQLSGSIPKELGTLTNIWRLGLGRNKLTSKRR